MAGPVICLQSRSPTAQSADSCYRQTCCCCCTLTSDRAQHRAVGAEQQHLELAHLIELRVRVEIMGSQKCRIVGKSQPALVLINPMTLFTRTRS
jgi:hypothetical protein